MRLINIYIVKSFLYSKNYFTNGLQKIQNELEKFPKNFFAPLRGGGGHAHFFRKKFFFEFFQNSFAIL